MDFDPSTATPAVQVFDPSTATQISDHDQAGIDASNYLAQYTAGDPGITKNDAGILQRIKDVSSEYSQAAQSESDAAQNQPGWLRAAKSVISGGMKAGTAAVNAVKNFPNISLGGKPEDWAEFGEFPKTGAELAQGVVTGVGKIPSVAMNLATGAAELNPMTAIQETLPGGDLIKEDFARARGLADVIQHYTNTGANDLAQKTGISNDTAAAMIGENLAYAAIPLGELSTAEGAANAVKNATNLAGNAIGGLKWAAAKSAPTIVGAAKAVTVDALLRKFGLSGGMDELLSYWAGFGSGARSSNPVIADKIFQAVSGQSLKEFTEQSAQVATKPMGQTINEAISAGLKQKATTLQEAADGLTADLEPEDATKVTEKASDGSYKYDIEDLSKDAQKVREKIDQVQDLNTKAAAALKRNDLQKVWDSSVQAFGNTVFHTALGTGAGAGFAGSQAPTGQTDEAVAQGATLGGILGLAGAPFATSSGMRSIRAAKGSDALIARGLGKVSGGIEDLSKPQQDYVHKFAGMVDSLGKKTIILETPDELRQSGNLSEGANPGFGFVDKDGNIHLNKEKIPTGALGHEFTHVTQQFFGEMLRKLSPDEMANFEDQYQQALKATGKQGFDSQSERDAEIGRLVLSHTPPELFYGGEQGGDVLRRIFSGMLGKGGVKHVAGFEAPYTRTDVEAMRQRFFKAGELASQESPPGIPEPAPKPDNIPSEEPEHVGPPEVPPEEHIPAGPGNTAAGVKSAVVKGSGSPSYEGGNVKLPPDEEINQRVQDYVDKGMHPDQAAQVVAGEILQPGKLKTGAELAQERKTMFMPEPNEEVRDTAADYVRKSFNGKIFAAHRENYPLNEDLSKVVADVYDSLPHEPNNPEVAKAYQAFKNEIKGQWETAVEHGFKFEPWRGEGQPYQNSAEMVKDVKDNQHLWFYPTEAGFGDLTAPNQMTYDHPLLEPSGIKLGGYELPYNDLFRPVHDLFGHSESGFQFGPRGEMNAFIAHSRMFSPEAIPALAAETQGQNAWVNFGKHLRDENGNIPVKGEPGYTPLVDRPIADQKATTLPIDLAKRVIGDSLTPKEWETYLSRIQGTPEAEAAKTWDNWSFKQRKAFAESIPGTESHDTVAMAGSPWRLLNTKNEKLLVDYFKHLPESGSPQYMPEPEDYRAYIMKTPLYEHDSPYGKMFVASNQPYDSDKSWVNQKPNMLRLTDPNQNNVAFVNPKILTEEPYADWAEKARQAKAEGHDGVVVLAPGAFMRPEWEQEGMPEHVSKATSTPEKSIEFAKQHPDEIDWEHPRNLYIPLEPESIRNINKPSTETITPAQEPDERQQEQDHWNKWLRGELPPEEGDEWKSQYMPEPYLGDVSGSGSVRGEKETPDVFHEDLGFGGSNKKWRYNPSYQRVSWWGKPTDLEKSQVTDFLKQRGQVVSRHDNLLDISNVNFFGSKGDDENYFKSQRPQFMPSPHPDAIDRVAVKDENGKIYSADLWGGITGLNTHGNVIDDNNISRDSNYERGYLTKTGKYLNATQALGHARNIKQYPKLDMGEYDLDTWDMEANARFMPMPNDPEAINSDTPAAIKTPDGKIWTGSWHPAAFSNMTENYDADQLGKWAKEFGDNNYFQTGFMTNGGEFVTPEQARKIVLDKSQMSPMDLERMDAQSRRAGLPPRPLESLALKKATQSSFADTMYQAMDESPAGALNLTTGQPDHTGEAGVEIYPEARQMFKSKPTKQQIIDYATKNRQILLDHPELRIGWDQTPQGWELNLGASGTREGATKVGTRLDQRAAWDIARGEEIPTGGKNQQTNFPDYPLAARLSDLQQPSYPPGRIGARGIWDSLPDDASGAKSDIAQELGIPSDKRYYQQKPTDKAKIDTYFKSSGQSQYMPEFVPKNIRQYILPDEEHILDNTKNALNKFMTIWDNRPKLSKGVEYALLNKDQKLWYNTAAELISQIFGKDANRFSALLASTSPNTPVEFNIENALHTWDRWLQAGRPGVDRPTTKSEIKQILEDGINDALSTLRAQGNQHLATYSGITSYLNNVYRSLTAEDPSPSVLKLSGPKVASFFPNLTNDVSMLREVTNDRHIGKFITQSPESGSETYGKRERPIGDTQAFKTKTPQYIATSAFIRQIADTLTKQTGETWTPRQAQAAIWSYIVNQGRGKMKLTNTGVPSFESRLKQYQSRQAPENPF